MGIFTKGYYTHGSLAWSGILTLSGSRQVSIGDTVWDTTYNKKRMWDGFNFVHTHQRSVPVSGSNMSYGSVLTVSANQDDTIRYSTSTADLEGVIGVAEDQKGQANGDYIPVHYHGDVKMLVEAGTGGNSADPGDFLDFGTLVKYSNPDPLAVGTYAIYIDTTATTNSTLGNVATLRRVIFRPVERN